MKDILEKLINKKNLNFEESKSVFEKIMTGQVQDELIEKFLTSNPNAVYATDVFCNEPYGGPLCQLKNVVLTPHVGSSSLETRIMMEREVAEELRSFKLTGTFKKIANCIKRLELTPLVPFSYF